MYVHTETHPIERFRDYGIDTYSTKAADRRNTVQMLYGDWFREHGLKLSRDYLVVFTRRIYAGYGHTDIEVEIRIKDPIKAVLFKLTFG